MDSGHRLIIRQEEIYGKIQDYFYWEKTLKQGKFVIEHFYNR